MSRTPATNQAKNSESRLRHDLEDFSRDLLGLHSRFQNMFPALSSPNESVSVSATATAAARSMDPVPGHFRDLSTRSHAALPPSPAITQSQPTADLNLTARLDRIISQEVKAKVKEEVTEIYVRLDFQQKELVDRVNAIYHGSIEPLQAEKKRVEEELRLMRDDKMKTQQAEEKMREELWGLIRKMQGEIEELKKARIQGSVEERVSRRETPPTYQDFLAYQELMSRRPMDMTPPDFEELDALEKLFPSSSREQASRDEHVQNYTSSALVPFSSQIDKNTNALNTKGLGQSGTPASVVSGLDLTTRPANRGQQSVASLQNTHIADSEPTIPATKLRSHSDRHSVTHPVSDSDEDNYSYSTTSAKRGSTSQSALRPGRHSQGTAATTTNMSRSRSPRPSLDASFRVRDRSPTTSNSKSRSTHRRSTSSSSIQSIPNDNDIDLSSQSIPSRFQPSRRTKSANELIDKHLSFIPNGWRTIIANTAKQLSTEDWDRSDARVLKKLEEHCPAFSNLEEILPDVRMAVPALRELMRELGRHP